MSISLTLEADWNDYSSTDDCCALLYSKSDYCMFWMTGSFLVYFFKRAALLRLIKSLMVWQRTRKV